MKPDGCSYHWCGPCGLRVSQTHECPSQRADRPAEHAYLGDPFLSGGGSESEAGTAPPAGALSTAAPEGWLPFGTYAGCPTGCPITLEFAGRDESFMPTHERANGLRDATPPVQPDDTVAVERVRALVEAEWFNGNLAEDCRDRLLAALTPADEQRCEPPCHAFGIGCACRPAEHPH